MDHHTQDEGITLGEICHIVGKKILYVLGIAVLVTVIAVLLLVFCLNPLTAKYSLEFSITYPSSDTLKYPDGTPFYYRELISYSVLEKAKETDSRFSKIDVDKMISEDDISIVAETQTENGVTQYTGYYTITVKGSYFSGKTVAADFIRAIADVPVNRAKTIASELDFRLDYEIFEGASYSDRLTLLDAQKKELLAQLDDLITLYSENYTVEGKTLKNYRAKIAVLYSDNDGGFRSRLQEELDLSGYVPVDYAEARIAELKNELALNEKTIAALKESLMDISSQTTNLTRAVNSASSADAVNQSESSSQIVIEQEEADLSQMLAQLVERNMQIEYQIEMLSNQENITAFEARLNAEYEKLADAAEMTNAVVNAVYGQESSANFTTSKAVKDGGVNVVLGGIGIFILVFAIACIVVCLKDYPAYKENRNKNGTEQNNGEEKKKNL